MITFSERLQEAMKKNYLRNIDLVEKCLPLCQKEKTTISRSDISQFLSGDRIPKYNKVRILAEVLGVTPDWLLGNDDEPVNNSISQTNINNTGDNILTVNSEIRTNSTKELTEEQKELLNLFAQFSFKERHEIFTYLYQKLEEKKKAQATNQ